MDKITTIVAEQRRRKMLELIREEGCARARQLGEVFNVSESTKIGKAGFAALGSIDSSSWRDSNDGRVDRV